MRLFLSAGEPSGDLHGANLVRELRRRRPGVELFGFGGDRMAQAGCELLDPLADKPIMGLFPALAAIPRLWGVLGKARQAFKARRPDAAVVIDNPGFHWWLAGCARKHGVPVSYFVPPQIWSWGTWRAAKMRRVTDQVLACLPFEDAWFRERGIKSRLIGHPYFDELAGQRLDPAFLAAQRARPGTLIGLLPGSRGSELKHNLPTLARAARLIHARRPETRFAFSCLKPAQADEVRKKLARLEVPHEVHHDRTPEIIELSHSLVAVSGSVSLELLYRERPAAVVYQHDPVSVLLGHLVLRSRYITLVNLLAGKELFPEYFSSRCRAPELAAHV
ncbi:MAG: lipid-A-disaccharide synthase, partial [Gemmataceae bacterium]|nr:lipid-A-disaccharide synthase [Gemmataceae bacterium]